MDIGRAIADGERRRSRTRLVGSSTGALAVALILLGGWAVAGPARNSGPSAADPSAPRTSAPASAPASAGPRDPAPPTECTLHRLGLPKGMPARSVVTGADPTGRYILGRVYPGDRAQVVVWDDGQVRKVALTGSDARLADITSSGVAVGTSYVGRSADKTAAWVYHDGKVSRLAGDNAAAYGINERQAIVGSVDGRPALWRTPTSQPTMLATPGKGWTGHAAGIDEDGTVVGRMHYDAELAGRQGSNAQGVPVGPDFAYLWRPDGSLQKLAVPTMRGKAVTTYTAEAIRNGWVAGWARLDEGDLGYIGAPRWNLRTGEVGVTDGLSLAEGVNRHGWVVGYDVLVAGDSTIHLPDLGKATLPRTTIGNTISDDGAIVAGQVDLHDVPVAVVWKCR